MDQHVIKMAALGRRFQLGDLYNYRVDQILTEYRCESADLPSGTQAETGFKLKLMHQDSDITHKWQHIGLDEHLQASILAGLFETEAEVDKLRGASHYVNAKFNPNEVTRTFIIRAINKKNRLDLPNFLNNNFETDGKLPDATHIVVGIAYGAEVYCVLAQNNLDEDYDVPEKIAEFLNHVSSMMEIALEEKQDVDEFKEQFTKEEKKLVDKVKCRVYADHQIQPVRECNLFNAYKHCLKLVNQVENIEKAVPVVAVLCPLRIVMKANEGLEKNFIRNVDARLVARCCNISTELDQVISTSESIRLSLKKMISHPDLNQFTRVVSKFKALFKVSWKKRVIKARESQDEDDQEVEKVVHIAETHPLFNISRLIRWLRFKEAEIEMAENLDSINGITFVADKTQLEKKLAFSFEKKFTVVLVISPLEQKTREILFDMGNYVDKNTELMAGDDDDSCDEIGLPWHMVTDKRKQVLDKIREMVDFVKKIQHLENDVQVFIIPVKGGKEFGCSFSIYRADNLLKDNLTQLPTNYDETCGGSDFSEGIDPELTLNMDRSNVVEGEERSIQKQKEIVVHPPILLVSDVTQTTAKLVWTPSSVGAASAACSHRIRYWRNGQRSSVYVSFDSSENQFRLEDLQPGSTYFINIVATSKGGQESAPSENIEFTTHQLQTTGVAPCISSTIVDEFKLLKELINKSSKKSDETKLAIVETGNQLNEKVKKSTECLTKRLQEMEKTISTMTKELRETVAESNRKLMEMSEIIDRHKAIAHKPLLQGEAKIAIEKKWFDTIELTYPNVKTMEDLILQGANVNAEDINGRNALHLVCRKNMNENLVDLANLLVANGVDVNAKDVSGLSALHILCQFIQNENLIDVVRFLVDNGADINAKTYTGKTALQFLCLNYHSNNLIDIVRLFVASGVDLNAKDNDGRTALHFLCQFYKDDNLIDVVRFLVANGVDVNARSSTRSFYKEEPIDLIYKFYKKENAKEILKLLGE